MHLRSLGHCYPERGSERVHLPVSMSASAEVGRWHPHPQSQDEPHEGVKATPKESHLGPKPASQGFRSSGGAAKDGDGPTRPSGVRSSGNS